MCTRDGQTWTAFATTSLDGSSLFASFLPFHERRVPSLVPDQVINLVLDNVLVGSVEPRKEEVDELSDNGLSVVQHRGLENNGHFGDDGVPSYAPKCPPLSTEHLAHHTGRQ